MITHDADGVEPILAKTKSRIVRYLIASGNGTYDGGTSGQDIDIPGEQGGCTVTVRGSSPAWNSRSPFGRRWRVPDEDNAVTSAARGGAKAAFCCVLISSIAQPLRHRPHVRSPKYRTTFIRGSLPAPPVS